MISTKKLVSAFWLASALTSVQAQDAKPSGLEKKGIDAYSEIRYSDALTYFKSAYQNAPTSIELTARIADCYWLVRNYDSAYVWYAKLPADRLAAYPLEKRRLADLTATLGKPAEAAPIMAAVPGFSERAAGFAKIRPFVRDSANWKVQYLQGINTDVFREFSPALVDGGLIWSTNQPKKFTSNGVNGWDNMGYNRLMKVSDLKNLSPQAIPGRNVVDMSSLDPKRPKRLAHMYALSDVDLLKNINIPASLAARLKQIAAISTPVESMQKLKYNVAHASYQADNKTLFVSANRQGRIKNATRTMGVAAATLNGAVFSNLAFILEQSEVFSSMHPAIHANGNMIVFSSNKEGGAGGYDLYVTEKDADGKWSAPRSLAGVNTPGNELFPTFGADGKFYFSSDGRAGLGGLDIYSSSFTNASVKDIAHLSFPVNSSFDDFGVTVMADGKTGYFSSDRLGSDDVYSFDFEKKIVKLIGKVNSMATNSGKPNVEVSLQEKDDQGNVINTQKVTSDAAGNFSFPGSPNREYDIVVNDGTHPSVSITFNTDGARDTKDVGTLSINDIPARKPFEKQQFIVYFHFDKSNIRSEYEEVLKKVATIMAQNPDVVCMLSGHTDQFGPSAYNLTLSAMRAESVKKYLESLGVNIVNVETKSFGENQLIQRFNNKKKSEINRRVEIVLQEK
jgi:outer membrane protein OmpA-like peptidoglycan-associated protein